MPGVKFSVLVCQLFDSGTRRLCQRLQAHGSFIPRLQRECPKYSRHPHAAQLLGWPQRLYPEHSYAAAFRADGLFSPTPFAFLPDDSSALPRCPLALKEQVATSVAGSRSGYRPVTANVRNFEVAQRRQGLFGTGKSLNHEAKTTLSRPSAALSRCCGVQLHYRAAVNGRGAGAHPARTPTSSGGEVFLTPKRSAKAPVHATFSGGDFGGNLVNLPPKALNSRAKSEFRVPASRSLTGHGQGLDRDPAVAYCSARS